MGDSNKEFENSNRGEHLTLVVQYQIIQIESSKVYFTDCAKIDRKRQHCRLTIKEVIKLLKLYCLVAIVESHKRDGMDVY